MTSTVRRAGAFALVGTLALFVPVVSRAFSKPIATVVGPAPFILVAVLALYVVDEGAIFEVFARPGDRRDGRLYGLAGFSLAIAGLALLSVQFGLSMPVFAGSVFVLAYGNLAEQLVRTATDEDIVAVAGFVAGGFLVGIGAQLSTIALTPASYGIPTIMFFAASAALLASLLRTVLFPRDDPLVMFSVALLLWFFADLPTAMTVTTTRVLVALGVTIGLGYVSYALETASVPGMLTGVFLGLLTIVLGDYGWFAMLITFFGIGGLSTKYRYDEKIDRGIAEANEGARGSGNVLANSTTALVAVIGAAASPSHIPVSPVIFLFAFAGSIAAAMSDTLSSEIGGLFDNPRLVTTFQRVDPGTDGAVTWQGELAGVIGGVLIAAIALAMFDEVTVTGFGVIVAAGIVGMTADSLLGATIEGLYVDNQGVNFLATLVAAIAGGLLAVGLGLTAL
ncbi:MAG: TIGR00297 family protein [Halorientalis sp.]